ncbi:hypothetical protein D3C71_1285910 [compost metagenome]
MAKLATDQIDIRRETVGRDQARRLGHAQRRIDRAFVLGIIDQVGFAQLAQHEVAPVQRALGIAARIVIRRALDQADQQRDVLGIERGQITPEPELRARGHAVNGLAATLAQVDLVEVGLQDGALVVARFHDQRVQHLIELAGDGLLFADPEQATAGQLLGQGRGALAALATGANRHPDRAGDAAQINAVVPVEVLVLHCLQAGDQQLGGLFDPHQPALFLLLAVQRGDTGRIQARGLQRLAGVGVTQRSDRPAGQAQLDAARGDPAVNVVVATAGDDETPPFLRVRGW